MKRLLLCVLSLLLVTAGCDRDPTSLEVTEPSLARGASALTISDLKSRSGNKYAVSDDGSRVGARIYTDSPDALVGKIPARVAAMKLIRTANADRGTAAGRDLLSFRLDRQAVVYVAYDVQAPRPGWLTSGFRDTKLNLFSRNRRGGWSMFRLFSRTFAAGSVTLGGNEGKGANMYFVLLDAGSATKAPASDRDDHWDRVLKDVELKGDVVVPAGETWLIGANVRIAGNLRTEGGTIAMRPGSSLKFVGGDPEKYVGGGMMYEPRFANDYGIWVSGSGVLDIRGTPKEGWNRTGSDPTWKPEDEYWIAPTAVGDFKPRRWHPGDPIPQIDPRVPAAEVMNVTRDIVIEGPGHIHIHSSKPQRIEYVQLRGMGISNRKLGASTGRYALHLHHGLDGTRGTMIRGVAAINSRGRVFVPHMSHGITMIDNVSVNSYADGLWWDDGDLTNDLTVDRLSVSGVHMPRAVSGKTSRHDAIGLPAGNRLVIRNSAASGALGDKLANGFDWPESAGRTGAAVWEFDTANVAHNNSGVGLRFWTNYDHAHVVENTVTYRNGTAGIETGAYVNSVRYLNTILVDDNIFHHSSSKPRAGTDLPAAYEGVHVFSREGPALRTGKMVLAAQNRLLFSNCTLEAGPGAPKVLLESTPEVRNPVVVRFHRCGLTPDDIEIPKPYAKALAGTSIIIEHETGKSWEITLDMKNQRKRVRELR